jgi:hypothetical protein
MRAILFLVGVLAMGQTKFDVAVARVQVDIRIRLAIDISLPAFNVATTFPNGDDPGEAWVTPDAIYVSKSKIAAMKSGRDLAQFLSHAQAHARLDHAAKYAEHQRLMDFMRVSTPHLPPEIIERSWSAWWQKHEGEAKVLGEQIFATTDCARGNCKEFDALLREARKK